MATILLTDAEYNHIKSQLDEITGKIATASPRAATHYAKLAKLHADFLAKEDGKRAMRQTVTATRATLDQQRLARRANSQQQTASQSQRPAGSSKAS